MISELPTHTQNKFRKPNAQTREIIRATKVAKKRAKKRLYSLLGSSKAALSCTAWSP